MAKELKETIHVQDWIAEILASLLNLKEIKKILFFMPFFMLIFLGIQTNSNLTCKPIRSCSPNRNIINCFIP